MSYKRVSFFWISYEVWTAKPGNTKKLLEAEQHSHAHELMRSYPSHLGQACEHRPDRPLRGAPRREAEQHPNGRLGQRRRARRARRRASERRDVDRVRAAAAARAGGRGVHPALLLLSAVTTSVVQILQPASHSTA